jgi:hypothetical protein
MLESHAMMQRCKKQSIVLILFVAMILPLGLGACESDFAQLRSNPAEENPQDLGVLLDGTASPVPLSQELAPADDLGVSQEEINPGKEINPLTGQVVLNADRLKRRPILVKVTLFPRNNRPQWGLSHADIVYEHYTEGGLSRFSAVFYGQEAEIVGPIRSARFVDIQLVRMYGALFAYGSADQRVLEQIDSSEFAGRAIREFPAGCPPLCRVDPTVQNHLVTDTRALQDFYQAQGVDLSAPNLDGMTFEDSPPAGVQTGLHLQIEYSADNFHEWTYEAELGSYRRSQETGESADEVTLLTDQLTGEPIQSANVVLIKVPHELYARTPEIVEIQLYGEGEGLAMRDGVAYEVRWIRPYPEGVLYLTFPDGSAYPFKPGNTWFELVGISSEVVWEPGGLLRVTFGQP